MEYIIFDKTVIKTREVRNLNEMNFYDENRDLTKLWMHVCIDYDMHRINREKKKMRRMNECNIFTHEEYIING